MELWKKLKNELVAREAQILKGLIMYKKLKYATSLLGIQNSEKRYKGEMQCVWKYS